MGFSREWPRKCDRDPHCLSSGFRSRPRPSPGGEAASGIPDDRSDGSAVPLGLDQALAVPALFHVEQRAPAPSRQRPLFLLPKALAAPPCAILAAPVVHPESPPVPSHAPPRSRPASHSPESALEGSTAEPHSPPPAGFSQPAPQPVPVSARTPP